jgi:putative spermidine/putrescine transport system permease protein
VLAGGRHVLDLGWPLATLLAASLVALVVLLPPLSWYGLADLAVLAALVLAVAKNRRLLAVGWRRPWVKALLLLLPPLLWLGVIYLSSLGTLFISAFWQLNPFTTEIEHVWGLDNFRTILNSGAYRHIALRTIGIAAAVTVTDAVLAFPFAYYMARIAGPRGRAWLFVLILLPLWSSYLVRVYAWRLILDHDGILNWTLHGVGLPDANLAFTNWAVWIVFSYVWLPFMVLPVYASLERIPDSMLEASADLGARGPTTLRRVVLPLALPGLVAGSIFTFSLTLGDYITPTLVGGTSSQFIGNVVYSSVGIANNVPFAAAFATIPLIVMAVYLLAARRLGAFEAL